MSDDSSEEFEALVGDDIEGDVDDTTKIPPEPEVQGPLKPVSKYTGTEILVALLAVTAFGTALFNMIYNGGLFDVLGGLASIISAPYLYWQRNRLVDIYTFKEVTAFIESQLSQLTESNERIGKSIDGLEETNQKLEKLSGTLKKIAELGSNTIEDFAEQVEAQKANVADQGIGLRAQIQRLLMEIIDQQDTDGDGIFDEEEVDIFIEHLRHIEGLTIYEDNIRAQMIDENIFDCIDLIQQLSDPEKTTEATRIFDLEGFI